MKARLRLARLLSLFAILLLSAPLAACLPGRPVEGLSAVADPTNTPAPAPVAALPDEAAAANDLESQIIAVYEAVGPAVVNITARGYVYDWWRGAIPQEGSGSGFVYDAKGHIVTNYHVVENAEDLLVTLADGQVYEAE
ncbi:MAG: peptidase S1, partial [Chloroflexia bacterium]|nr:peptidase S1 [Chloroflexia bacterium]